MSGDKTEKASPKRHEELRKKGSSARSVELPAGLSLLALVVVLPSMTSRLLSTLRTDLAMVLGGADVSDLEQARRLGTTVVMDSVRALAPGLAIVCVTSLLAGCVVTRSKPNPAMLRPRAERMSPFKTIKRLLSVHSLVELLKSVVKLVLLGVVSYGAWKSGLSRLLTGGGGYEQLMALTGATVMALLWKVALLGVLVGVADAAWQRRSFGKQSRMSKQELIDENRQTEGDPHAKAHQRGRMLAASRGRMITAVPAADVVLANPTHLVVVLRYEPGSAAPVVVAKGAGATATRIKEVAAEHGVPVLADKPLARAIYRASEVGDAIPAELFRAVAEVLATVYAARRRGTRPVWKAAAA